MKILLRWCWIACLVQGLVGLKAWADDQNSSTSPAPPTAQSPDQQARSPRMQTPAILDNLFFDAGAGVEKPPGEDSTGFGLIGANWGIPLNPNSDGVGWGLQFGGNVKVRDDDPELNGTLGGFARNFQMIPGQQGAFAALFDYRHTAFHNDLWGFRPVLGSTITEQDALGVEAEASLNEDDGQRIANAFNGFWSRYWTEVFGTEFGAGYEFSHVNGVLFRGRTAYGLMPELDWWLGADVNSHGNYAIGTGLSYHFGGTGRHEILHNIGGKGAGRFTPFPDADFPVLLHRTR